MAQKNYIAVDLGAESGRVMAGRFDGGKIALEQFHRFPNGPVNLGGTLRWNLVSLWSEIQNGLREAASKLGGSAVSVGVDTWGVDFVLMNKNDELLGQPWNYASPGNLRRDRSAVYADQFAVSVARYVRTRPRACRGSEAVSDGARLLSLVP